MNGSCSRKGPKSVLVIAGLADSLFNFRGHLLAAMIARGYEVHVAAPDLPEGCSLRQRLEGCGLKVHDIPLRRTSTNLSADFFLFWTLWGLMLRIKPGVVFGYTIKPVIYGTLAAWMTRVPRRYALVTGLGYAFTGQASGLRGKVKAVVQCLYRQSLCRIHKVFFQNPDDQDLFCQLGLLSTDIESVVVNGSGVDLESFSVAPLPPGAPHFLLIARLLGDKGVREYASAAQQIKTTYPQVKFSLVGWLDENPDAINQAELDAWVAAGTLHYLGCLKDVRPAIAQCSVYVLPSYREGTPRTVLEAMAMGRAVITTDVPGCRETVMNGYNGFLVLPQSVDTLVNAMERFIREPDLARRMGQRCRALAECKYDVHTVNDVLLREMGL